MFLPPKPTMGRSYGTPINDDGLPGTAFNSPSRTSNEHPSATSTRSCGRATSHGSRIRSQLSGASCCQPLTIDCRNIPYS
jgi:hypothetical protein